MAIDPATATLLIRVAGDLAVTLINIYKRLGKDDQAQALASILAESDDLWTQVRDRAQAALAHDDD